MRRSHWGAAALLGSLAILAVGSCGVIQAELVAFDCGGDSPLVFHEATYCFYCSPDAACPEDLVGRVEVHGGVICSSDELERDTVPLGVAEELDARCKVAGDAGAD